MSVLANIDENTLREELIAFMDKKIRKSAMTRRMVSVKMIEETATEFIQELRTKHLTAYVEKP